MGDNMQQPNPRGHRRLRTPIVCVLCGAEGTRSDDGNTSYAVLCIFPKRPHDAWREAPAYASLQFTSDGRTRDTGRQSCLLYETRDTYYRCEQLGFHEGRMSPPGDTCGYQDIHGLRTRVSCSKKPRPELTLRIDIQTWNAGWNTHHA